MSLKLNVDVLEYNISTLYDNKETGSNGSLKLVQDKSLFIQYSKRYLINSPSIVFENRKGNRGPLIKQKVF